MKNLLSKENVITVLALALETIAFLLTLFTLYLIASKFSNINLFVYFIICFLVIRSKIADILKVSEIHFENYFLCLFSTDILFLLANISVLMFYNKNLVYVYVLILALSTLDIDYKRMFLFRRETRERAEYERELHLFTDGFENKNVFVSEFLQYLKETKEFDYYILKDRCFNLTLRNISIKYNVSIRTVQRSLAKSSKELKEYLKK